MESKDGAFISQIVKYAEHLKGAPLTNAETAAIVQKFNENTAESSTFNRVKLAIETVIPKSPEKFEKFANLDNTQRLLEDLRRAAEAWAAKK